ncbi:MAG TPA: hypothetical protein VMZ33_00170 [Candidatus Limnocylindrales bacterium]|nr:hypothetical protein [Candidatus Limnocylindrales bacterium]
MMRNAVEWAVLAFSVLAIATLAGALVLTGLNEQRPAEPLVELRAAEARTTALGWLIPATVRNAGDETAEAVVLEAAAQVDGKEEISEMEVAFLPAGSESEIVFAFSAEPESEVTVRLVGFGLP